MTIRYAIGDVHGESDRLARLHDAIMAHHVLEGGDALLVHVGDLIDRGPNSRGVVKRVMEMEARPPPNMKVACVMGNHEQMLLEAMRKDDRSQCGFWFDQGGDKTIESYERVNGAGNPWHSAVDRAHVAWLSALPSMIRDAHCVFVHGGIDPARFPECPDDLRLWTRSQKFFDEARWPHRQELKNILVVHGHTPTNDSLPEVSRRRINIDTGVCYGGPLTCVVLIPGERPRFLGA